MDIRSLTTELLREGPRHNQLLSPLTRYLGVCGDERAGVVTVPFEHIEFVEVLNELRYKVTTSGMPAAWSSCATLVSGV